MANIEHIEKYRKNQIPSEGNPVYNEAWALVEVSRRMAAVIEHGDLRTKKDKEQLREALRLNLRIWTMIQAEQSFGENLLPDPIRKNILSLCVFIDKHTMKALPKPTPQNVIVLIDINRNIAAGLLGSTEDGAEDTSEKPGDQGQTVSREHIDKKKLEPIKIEA